jgi:hypothetical protein
MVSSRDTPRHWSPYIATGVAALAIAGVIGWSLMPSKPLLASHRDPHHEDRENRAGGRDCEPQKLATLGSGQAAERRRAKCAAQAEEHALAYEESYQTERGANAAEQGTLESFYQARAAWAQTVLLFLAFAASIWAAVGASRAADAANRSVTKADETLRHAQKSSEQELRAYIHVENILGAFPVADGQQTTVFLHQTWRNLGKTPAIHCRSDWNHIFIAGDLPTDFAFPDSLENTEIVFGVGPSHIVTATPIQIQIGAINMLFNRAINLYVWGWIEYDDVFENTPRRRTEFCARGLPGAKIDSAARALMFEHHPRHNGSDDDCEKKPTPFVRAN